MKRDAFHSRVTFHGSLSASYVPDTEGDDNEALFIEVDGTPLLEPCRKGASVYRARGNNFEPTCHLLSDNQSFGGGARAVRSAKSFHSLRTSPEDLGRAKLETAELEIGVEVDIRPQGER